MKFDTIIIGGGLSGLMCGIKLSENGQRCLILSSGQSTLHINPGALDLLGSVKGEKVENPVEEVAKLGENHPYSLVGASRMETLSTDVKGILERAGIKMNGSATKNVLRVSPTGNLVPTWLVEDGVLALKSADELKGTKVLIATLKGFMDFPTEFIAEGLESNGASCIIKGIVLEEVENIRKNPSEMRSINISRVLEDDAVLRAFADKIKAEAKDCDMVVIPAVVGYFKGDKVAELEKLCGKQVRTIATLPPSLPGVRLQTLLRKRFQALGGTYVLGETVVGAEVENGKVVAVRGERQGDITFSADNFVLASGSFVSHGLATTRNEVYEPIFGLDVESGAKRTEWYDEKMFNEQPYQRYGVKTNAEFKAFKGGKTLDNLFVTGSLMSGANRVKEGSLFGLSAMTGVRVAELVGERSKK